LAKALFRRERVALPREVDGGGGFTCTALLRLRGGGFRFAEVAPVPDFRCSAFCRFGRRDIVSLIEDVWTGGKKETERLFHE